MADTKCPDCGGERLERYGRTKAGLQKYRCLDPKCRRQFVDGSSHLIDDKTKNTVQQLLAAGTAPKIIAQAMPDISLRWIYDLRRRMKHVRD